MSRDSMVTPSPTQLREMEVQVALVEMLVRLAPACRAHPAVLNAARVVDRYAPLELKSKLDTALKAA